MGTDTLLNSVFSFSTQVERFAENNPAFYTPILQGPHSYIPGTTFIDNNGDGYYSPGIDSPVDTAVYKYGGIIPDKKFPGAKNLSLSSSHFSYYNFQQFSSPDDVLELYFMLKGFNRYGRVFDPCTYFWGMVKNENCTTINPFYMYSGDPITDKGWLSISSGNLIRQYANTGPFKLIKNEPVEIITAYIAGRGTTHLNSIEVARDNVRYAIDNYNNNFYKSGKNSPNHVSIENYKLSQNFPNPFNPVTKIRYSVPSLSNISLKIYDILGREVAVLINNQPHPLGEYEIDFNAAELSSGVYLYHLTSGSSSVSKKMLLLK